MSRKLITTISMAVAFATSFVVAIPVAGADPGPPQQGGGCNMVFGPAFHSPNSNGLDNMMSGSANGEGAANMPDMLSRFSSYASTFCFAP